MDLIFKCHTLLHIPRNGTTIIGRRCPIASWDNVLISRKHIQIHVDRDGTSLDLSVTGRNAVVVERREQADGWDVVAVVDPGAATLLPLATLATNHSTRLYVMGAREESAIELRPASGATSAPPPLPTAAGAVAGAAVAAAAGAATAATPDAAREVAVGTSTPHEPSAKRRRRLGHVAETAATATTAGTSAATATATAAAAAGGVAAAVTQGHAAANASSATPSTNPRTAAPETPHPGPTSAGAAAPGAASQAAAAAAAAAAAVVASGRAAAAAASTPTARGAAAGASAGAPSAAPYDMESPIHLMRVRGLAPRHNAGCLGARLRRLVAGPGLQLALVSNFMVDMGWLMSCCPDLASARQLFVVHGESSESEPEMRQEAAAAGAGHILLHRPPLPIAYGTHHSKAFLLTYPAGLRLIIFTANAIYADCNDKSQGLWVQDFPRKAAAPAAPAAAQPSDFERDLMSYIRALALPAAMAGPVLEAVAAHDFTYARGALVASVPGYHRGAAVQQYGHMRLRRLLAQVPLPPGFNAAAAAAAGSGGGGSGAGAGASATAAAAGTGHRSGPSPAGTGAGGGAAAGGGGGGGGGAAAGAPSEGLVIQCSSMGSFDQAWLLDEFGASLAAHRRGGQQAAPPAGGLPAAAAPARPSGPPGCGPLPLAVVWPTVDEVRDSLEGWSAGRSIPGPAKNVHKPFMRRYYARWGGQAVGRQRAMPHIKTYTRYRGQQLAWFLVTSHNLSKAAWGDLQKNGTQLMIRSYELGVLVTPDLEAAYRSSPQLGFCCNADPGTPQRPTPLPQTQRLPAQAPVASAAAPPAVSFWTQAAAAEGHMPAMPAGEVACVLPVPYTLPPALYRGGQDQPWAWDQPQAGVDALGQQWGTPFSHYGHREPASDD